MQDVKQETGADECAGEEGRRFVTVEWEEVCNDRPMVAEQGEFVRLVAVFVEEAKGATEDVEGVMAQ